MFLDLYFLRQDYSIPGTLISQSIRMEYNIFNFSFLLFRPSFEWTENQDNCLQRKILLVELFKCKQGSTEAVTEQPWQKF